LPPDAARGPPKGDASASGAAARRSCRLSLGELLDRVARDREIGRPELERQSGLVLQVREELAHVGQALPDLRQECCASAAPLQRHAIDAGAQLRMQFVFTGDDDGCRRRQQGNLDLEPVVFGASERQKTGIVEGGRLGIGPYIVAEQTVRVQRTDASAQAAVRPDEAWGYYLEAMAAAERLGHDAEVQRLRAWATMLWSRWRGMMTGDTWIPSALDMLDHGLADLGEELPSFELGAFLTGRAAMAFWGLGTFSPETARKDAERAVEIAQDVDSEILLSYALDTLYAVVMRDGFCESGSFAQRAAEVGRGMDDRGEAHELLVTAAIAFAHAGRFEDALIVGNETVALAARLGPHRTLHTGSALTHALLPPGQLLELREATATAPALVVEEGMRTCFHGLNALAGQALCAFECGDDGAARHALEIFDAAKLSGRQFDPAHRIDMLRPLIGAANARHRLSEIEPMENGRPDVQQHVHRVRVELQLSALERDWANLEALGERARKLSRSACAPYLEWIADWAFAVQLADAGEGRDAGARALAAATALESCGERYLAARLLVDLLPVLDPAEARVVAADALTRLDAMGAQSSAVEARAYL